MSLVLLSSLSLVTRAECQLSVRVFDFAPQFVHNPQGSWQGMAVELIEAVLKEAKCTPQYHNLTWKRSLYLLEHGGLDIMLNMSITPQRQEYLQFIGPLRDETMILVASRGLATDISHLDDLKKLDKRVGILRGAFYGTGFADKLKSDAEFAVRFEQANSTDTNIGKLKKHRIAGFFNDKYNANYILKTKLDATKYKVHPLILNQDYVYIGVSKKSVPTALRELLNNAFLKAKK